MLCNLLNTGFAGEGVNMEYFLLIGVLGKGGNLRTLVSNDRNLSPNGLVIKGNVLVHVIEMPRGKVVSGAPMIFSTNLYQVPPVCQTRS